jgi:O-antigen ligase
MKFLCVVFFLTMIGCAIAGAWLPAIFFLIGWRVLCGWNDYLDEAGRYYK